MLGIDLGTTNTVVAAVRDGVAGTLADPEGERLLPSVVSFHPSGSVLVGRAAQERRLVDPQNTVYSIKRLIGRGWDSPEVQEARDKLPFHLREGPTGGTVVALRAGTFSLPEISAFVLRQAKAIAEAALRAPVERVVVTVPANFNDLQRAATKTAGRLAGLDVVRILNEPTAAALAYGPPTTAQERVAVYDFGGGTFDVTLLDLAGSVFEVIATAGDTALGGDDIDVVVADRMADDLLKKHGFDARADPVTFGRLRLLAEHAKRQLSVREEYTVTADDIVSAQPGTSREWRFRMTRPELEWASLPLIERTFKVCTRALEVAAIEPGALDRIILVGGATRMPMVARKVEQFFGRAPVVRINPDEVVSLGAAIQASLLDGPQARGAGPTEHPRIATDSVVQPVPTDRAESAEIPGLPVVNVGAAPETPLPEGRSLSGEFLPGGSVRPLVFDMPEANAVPSFDLELDSGPRAPNAPAPRPPPPLPTAASPKATLLFAPPSPPIAPRPAPLLIDVTPLSLSVETVGGYCDVLIDANTPVPCDRVRAFATASHAQTTVRVRVAQGESKRFSENTFLGELELSGIAPASRGEAQIAVTFEIDADGILNVRARDATTGRETAAHIQLVGAQNDPHDLDEMRARQAANPLAALQSPR
jgi:molecular chaperone DnaK